MERVVASWPPHGFVLPRPGAALCDDTKVIGEQPALNIAVLDREAALRVIELARPDRRAVIVFAAKCPPARWSDCRERRGERDGVGLGHLAGGNVRIGGGVGRRAEQSNAVRHHPLRDLASGIVGGRQGQVRARSRRIVAERRQTAGEVVSGNARPGRGIDVMSGAALQSGQCDEAGISVRFARLSITPNNLRVYITGKCIHGGCECRCQY